MNHVQQSSPMTHAARRRTTESMPDYRDSTVHQHVNLQERDLWGRHRRRWEDSIRMDLEEISINAGNWVDSALDRNYWRALVNAAMNLQVP